MKMPIIVSIFIFTRVEYEKCFYNIGACSPLLSSFNYLKFSASDAVKYLELLNYKLVFDFLW